MNLYIIRKHYFYDDKMYYDTDAELDHCVNYIESLGYHVDKSLRLRLSIARVYSFEAFLKAYIRESKEIINYAKKYLSKDFKFKRWFVEQETQLLLLCNKIPDLSLVFSSKHGLFIIPVEIKRIARRNAKVQLISYLNCAIQHNIDVDSAKAYDMTVLLVSYFSDADKNVFINIADVIEIFKPKIKIDVVLLENIHEIAKTILNKPKKIRKVIHKTIKKTKDKIEKLIILGVILFIGTKMPEVVSNVDVKQTATKAIIDELQKIPEQDIWDSIDSLPSDIIPYLPPRLIPYLNEEQIKHLTPEQIKHLTPEQIKHLTPEQIKHLTPEQIKHLTPDQLKHLTYEQLLNADPEEIEKMLEYLKKHPEILQRKSKKTKK